MLQGRLLNRSARLFFHCKPCCSPPSSSSPSLPGSSPRAATSPPAGSSPAAPPPPPPAASGASPPPQLEAIVRHKKEKDSAATHRARGLISGVVSDCLYSDAQHRLPSRDQLLVYLKAAEVSALLHTIGKDLFPSTVVVLQVRSWLKPQVETFIERVLPRTVHFDTSGCPTNVRFVRAPVGVKQKLNCPVVIQGMNDCVGVRKGGVLKMYYKYVALCCVADSIPNAIDVDVSKLDVGEQILLADIKSKYDLHPDADPRAPICEIVPDDEGCTSTLSDHL